MRVFLTGGTGLLGSHLASDLLDRGHQVVALCRPGSDASFLGDRGVTLVEGDVRQSPGDLVPGLSGCSHVVHGAALVYAGGSWAKIRAVNVDGTVNVLRAAVEAGVGHAIHVSSVAVYGSVEGPANESTPLDADLSEGDLYARSKRQAEEAARSVERASGLRVSVVRPSAVYGERDRLLAPALAPFLSRPVAPLLGNGENALPVVYAGNVAVAIRLALEAGLGGETFDLGMDHPLTQRTLFRGLAAGLGRSPRLVSLPAALIRGTSGVLSRLGLGAPGAPHLPLERVVRLALGENPYPSRRAHDVLKWRPPYVHEPALLRTGRWLLENPAQGERHARKAPDRR
jgi:nucleoside-diphosphate-sugar epimerase